jgi:hypothetical protein
MMAHVTGQSRYQSTLFPEVLDEVPEAETRRNVQVMWLLNRPTPAFKTIADSARTTRRRS